MKNFKAIIISMLYMAFAISLISCGTSGISISQTEKIVKQYETLFIPFQLDHSFDNPYNPAEIKVDAFITTPDSQTITLPCFYKSGESGSSEWEARFTPSRAGQYSYYIQSVSTKETAVSETRSVKVAASGLDGFLSMNTESWYSLRFDSGKQFRGVGLNICWDMESDWKHPYETYFNAAEENDINFIRLWMCSWNLPLEWSTINNYNQIVDEFENWDKTIAHTDGLKMESGMTPVSEDDEDRVRFPQETTESIIYNLENIRRFKIKMFYHKELSLDKIKAYGSTDNVNYTPIEAEYSESRFTEDDWYRIYFC
ncbi:MAG: DUF5060 domain-containing protein, partial [Candidatus Heimdallarchaeota archaeon]|nr:DUF5060 domain-containing protein [Candidatus Heimdallarchaeota archaeon]